MQEGLLATNLKKVISLVDNLRDLGLEELIKLPKVVVVGSQSAGKSSLLEQIVGIDFLPRGSGVVTRRPLELRLTYDPKMKQAIAKFDQIPGESFTDFNKVRDKINSVTDKVCGSNKNIVDKPIILNVSSPSCPTLTIVDLPGITANAVGDQPQNIYEITKGLVMKYINDPRSIILCVIPANQDISVSQALKLCMEVDPKGERSLGCLTKIDIMNRGDNARQILLNQTVELKYGFVGIKNRNNQDIIDNKPVAKSLEEEKNYFAQSPVYSTLPPGTTGTQALTDKITKILYSQIKGTMPEIVREIAKKKGEVKEKLQKLGPGIAKTPQQLIDFVWKMIAKFLKVYKNSLQGMRDEDYGEQPFGPHVRKTMSQFYKDQYQDQATEDITDKDIQGSMYKYPGNSIPGFPSIDAFLALLNPLMSKLKSPAMLLIDQVYREIQGNIVQMIDKIMVKQYPIFIQRFQETVINVLNSSKQSAKTAVTELLDAELDYLYTNDLDYLIGDFKISEGDKKKMEDKKRQTNPLVYELRKRIDAYFKIVVRNLRDLIPKQVSYFILVKGTKDIQFQAYNFIAHSDKLQKWFLEPNHIREDREKSQKALETLDSAEKRIRRDPEFGKFVRPDAIEKMIKNSKLKPIETKKVVQKPSIEDKSIPKSNPHPQSQPKPQSKPQSSTQPQEHRNTPRQQQNPSSGQSTSANPKIDFFKPPSQGQQNPTLATSGNVPNNQFGTSPQNNPKVQVNTTGNKAQISVSQPIGGVQVTVKGPLPGTQGNPTQPLVEKDKKSMITNLFGIRK